MSVTCRQNVTWYPLARSQRTMMSKFTPDRICPICGGACTVAPHKYSDTRPGCSGTNSRTARAAVSWMRSVTSQGYGMRAGPRAPLLVVVVGDHVLRPDPDDHALFTGPVAERLAGVLDREFLDQLGGRILGELGAA